MGFIRGEVDQCIYYIVNDKDMLFIAIYVDDVLIFGNNIKKINDVKKKLSKKFKMKDMGEASTVLGIQIKQDTKGIQLSQAKYISDVLTRFGMSDCNPATTPMDYNQKLTKSMSPESFSEKEKMSNVPYMQAIGCLLFAAQISRPDICYAVSALSRFSSNPGKAHWEAVKRVMRYLKGTINKSLVYTKNKNNGVTGYCDADWAGNIDDRKSTTGYVFMYQSGAITWSTRKQKTVALSSTEAEFMSITAAIQESIWLKRLESELNPKPEKSTILFSDNKGAIQVALNNKYSSRTKHVDIKAKFIQEKLNNKDIILKYLPTNEMVADVFTKPVTPQKMGNFCDKLGLI